jgi:hypothetical protein
MVKVWVAPELTLTAPDGDIEPFVEADAVMVKPLPDDVFEFAVFE